MARIRADYVFGTTDTALTNTDTTLSSPELARLPAVTAPDVAAITLHNAAAGTYEIVHVTAHAASATTATITRGMESSTAAAWTSGSSWLHGATSSDFTVIAGGVQSVVAGTNVTVNNTDPANPIVSASSGGGTDRALVDPTSYSWSWINQGVASIATDGASLQMSSPVEGADNWHFRAKAVPAKPYSVIVHQKITRVDANYSGVCVGWLRSSDNRFAVFDQRGAGMIMESSYSTAPFAITGNYVSVGGGRLWEWVKLTDDATSRKIYISANGKQWVLFHSVATNDQITPDRLIFGLQSRSSFGVGLTIDSWEEGV